MQRSRTDELATQLDLIADELADLALGLLRDALAGDSTESPDPDLVAEEKRLTRARRSVEKAASLLRNRPGPPGDPD